MPTLLLLLATQAGAAPVFLAVGTSPVGQPEPALSDPRQVDPCQFDPRHLSPEGNEKVAALQGVLETLAGQMALADEARSFAAELEPRAMQQALQRLVDSLYVETQGRLVARSGSEPTRSTILTGLRRCETDLAQLRPAIEEIVRGLAGGPAIHADLRQLLESEEGPALFYLHLARLLGASQRGGPSAAGNGLLVAQGGDYVIAPGREQEVRETLERYRPIVEAVDRARKRVAEVAARVEGTDELHERFKRVLTDPWLVPFLVRGLEREGAPGPSPDISGNLPADLSALGERIAAKFESALERSPRGWRIRGNLSQNLQQGFDRFASVRPELDERREAALALAEKMRGGDPLCAGLRDLMTTEVYILDSTGGAAATDGAMVVRHYLEWAVYKRRDGKREVNRHAEGRLRDDLRSTLQAERAYRELAAATEELRTKIAEDSLARLFTTPAGLAFLVQTLRDEISARPAEGRTEWVERHFAMTGGRYVLRDGHSGAVEKLLERAVGLRNDIASSATRLRIDPSALTYTSDHLQLWRSSAYYNPRTTVGSEIYSREFDDHFAARLFGVFEIPARYSTDSADFERKLRERNEWLPQLAATHRKLIIMIAGMPPWLSSSRDTTTFCGDAAWRNNQAHSPKDYRVWRDMVRSTVRMCRSLEGVERYYEVWNEPDGEYWQEGVDAYLRLYEETVRVVKEEDPRAKVGGSALNRWEGKLHADPKRDNLNLELIRFAARRSLPLDFVSWHHFGRPLETLPRAKETYVAELRRQGFTKLPEFVISEWAVPFRGSAVEAAAMAETMLALYKTQVDLQTVAAWQEFVPTPDPESFAPWGLITQFGLKKPQFHVHQIFDRLSRDSQGVSVLEWPSSDEPELAGGARAVVSKKGEGRYELLLWETGLPRPLVAALHSLERGGVNRAELKAYNTPARLEEAFATTEPVASPINGAIDEARRVYRQELDKGAWTCITFPPDSRPRLLAAEAVRFDRGPLPVVVVRDEIACAMDRGEMVRLEIALQ
ncbi:MAG: hypothetical protein AB1486_08650 [Planctomycetota bacterium]